MYQFVLQDESDNLRGVVFEDEAKTCNEFVEKLASDKTTMLDVLNQLYPGVFRRVKNITCNYIMRRDDVSTVVFQIQEESKFQSCRFNLLRMYKGRLP